jgi:23S rRNA pseudouridine1911/1915/1917 synthase
MHTVPLKQQYFSQDNTVKTRRTLLDWCAAGYPQVLAARGAHEWEGGMVHRLDYETAGLTLAAKTQKALDTFRAQQELGLFIKTYRAVCRNAPPLKGFPPAPAFTGAPCVIASPFRPFGPGGKAVRPALRAERGNIAWDQGKPYRTKVIKALSCRDVTVFTVQIARGFRHQIRCHLAWLGFPILNDLLYGGVRRGSFLGLTAVSLSFFDPRFPQPRTAPRP